MPSLQLAPTANSRRVTRRQMLGRPGNTATTGLLVACDAAQADAPVPRTELMSQAVTAALNGAPAAAAQNGTAPKAQATALTPFGQATQTSFLPIDSGLTFGPPTDLAAGWDGTLWA